jgi:hypothetical protein
MVLEQKWGYLLFGWISMDLLFVISVICSALICGGWICGGSLEHKHDHISLFSYQF